MKSLRERSDSKIRQQRCLAKESPEKGAVILIEEDNMPKAGWKMGRIKSLIKSSDNKIRAANVELPNKKVIQRSLKFLYPLEVEDQEKNVDEKKSNENHVKSTGESSQAKKNIDKNEEKAQAHVSTKNSSQVPQAVRRSPRLNPVVSLLTLALVMIAPFPTTEAKILGECSTALVLFDISAFPTLRTQRLCILQE